MMIYSIIGYWLILLGMTYLNMRVLYKFNKEYKNWNWVWYKENSTPGVIFYTLLYLGYMIFGTMLFIGFTEWWFDMSRTLNIW